MPSRDDVRRALKKIKRASDFEYFFDQLEVPGWIDPLYEEGLFDDPPSPVSNGKYINFPTWPQSRYLRRVAAKAPSDVLKVAMSISTNNPRIHEDLVDASLAMPASVAARLSAKACEWIATPYPLQLPLKLAELVVHLANGGQQDAALRLARSLLAVRPDPHRSGINNESALSRTQEPVGWFDSWHYKQVVSRLIPSLASAYPNPTLRLFVDVLEEAVSIAQPHEEEGEDYSYIWHPTIEDDPQNIGKDVREVLVDSLRDTARLILDKGLMQLTEILDLLKSRKQKVFERLSLYFIRIYGRQYPEIVRKKLTDTRLFYDICVFHEYWQLVSYHFDLLFPDEQNMLLRLLNEEYEKKLEDIQQSPDLSQPKTQEKNVKRWLSGRLSLLDGKLPDSWQKRYIELKEEVGIPKHPDLLYYSSATWVGPTSPKSVTELERMPTKKLIAFLQTWLPPSGHMADSQEGLSRALTNVVGKTPDRYARSARTFRGLAPAYVRGILMGLSEGLKDGRTFPWKPVLDLCSWVVKEPREIPDLISEYRDLDPGWVWTRKEIARLLALGFEARAGCMSIYHRKGAWSILYPLTNDPDPTQEHEAKYGPPNMDPLTLSINSVRGEAMHAVVRYALWVRRHLESTRNAQTRLARGFDELKEVRSVLTAHLNPVVDSSLAIRAVYGQWLPWLYLLDPDWTEANISRILPSDNSVARLREAAWNTYLNFSGVFDNMLVVLSHEYATAVERINAQTVTDTEVTDDRKRLAEHLMTYYWRGRIPLVDPDGLLQHFFNAAPPDLRKHALSFIGHQLYRDEKSHVPEKVVERLVALWEWRFSAASKLAQEERTPELSEYGWWFASDVFDEEWSLQQLLQVLAVCRKVEGSHLVLDRLADLAEQYPCLVVEAVRRMAMGDDEECFIRHEDQRIDKILRTALANSDMQARKSAKELIHLFGAMGIRGFRHLLHAD